MAEIGLAEDDGALSAQPRDERGVAVRNIVLQGEGASRGGHVVRCFDIVLDQDRQAVERAERLAGVPLCVQRAGGLQRIRVQGEDRLQRGAGAVDQLDPVQIGPG